MKLLISFLFAAVAAFAQSQHSVTLSWTWAQGSGGAATGFNVKRATVSGGPYTVLNTSPIPVTVLGYTDTAGLVEGTKYFYVVTATGPGGESAPSNEAGGTVPFSVPQPPATLDLVVK